MNDEERARRDRARARASWPGRLTTLEDMPEHELVEGSPAELIGMVKTLTLAAWAMRGEPIPDYDRAHMPGRVIRPPKDETT